MQLEAIDVKNLSLIYGIHGKILTMPTEAIYAGSMLGVLQPGETTRYHRHHDYERFIIVAGQGEIKSDHQVLAMTAGNIIDLPPANGHILVNTDPEKNLVFVSIWWSEQKGAVIPRLKASDEKITQYVIIPPPPTPNGDLHLGHLAGPYLAADMLKRFLCQQGKAALLITGSDDHQSYVQLKAKQQSVKSSPAEVAESYAQRIQRVFQQFGIQQDIFYRPLDNTSYIDFVQNYFLGLLQSGAIEPKEAMQPYCEHCQQWLFEADLSGYCLHCHSPCGGGSCETCAMPNQGVDIVKHYCKYCRHTPQARSVTYLYLSLEKFRKRLQPYLHQLKLPAHIRAFIRQLFAHSLPDVAITRHGTWGIPAPFPGFEDQKINTWCEMVPAYLFAASVASGAALDQLPSGWRSYWNKPQVNITLFFGFDNTFFYTVLFPALLLADAVNNKLPDNIIYNEFYLFEHSKFSTSRGHAIWAKDIINEVSADCLRYYLAATRPEMTRTNFDYALFTQVINQDLAGDLSTWLLDLAQRITTDFNGISPDGGEWNIEHDGFIHFLQTFLIQYTYELHPEHFSPVKAITLLRELVNRARELASSTQFLRNDHQANRLEYQTTLVIELTAAKYYALASVSIMPNFAQQLARSLHISLETPWDTQVRLFPKDILINQLSTCIFEPLTAQPCIENIS